MGTSLMTSAPSIRECPFSALGRHFDYKIVTKNAFRLLHEVERVRGLSFYDLAVEHYRFRLPQGA